MNGRERRAIGRVRHRATFVDLRRRGVRAASGPVTVTHVDDDASTAGDSPTAPAGLARVAFALPRRVGKAVVRNRVRRRLRAIFSEAGADRVPSGAYLVAARPGVADLSYRELSEHVHRALAEIAARRRRQAARREGARPVGTAGADAVS